ncbi:MAG: PilZ domain-containing protein [Actinomycetia bacterium]|nr:PilZ domain-containing protein [Actinomycetes bacterium]
MAALERPDPGQEVTLVLAGRPARTRVVRRLGSDFYLEALREGDKALTPVPQQPAEMRFADQETYWAMPVLVQGVLDPIPILVVRQTGAPRIVEQRAAPRARIQVPLDYALPRPASPVYTTTTLDLSELGLRFPSAFRTWVGLELKLTLRLAGEDHPILARVVRVSPHPLRIRGRAQWETAVRYGFLAPATQAKIRETVEAALARQRRRAH